MKSALRLVCDVTSVSSRETKSSAPIMAIFLRLARSLDAQVGSPFRPGAGKIGMGQRLRFIGEQQHNVARQRLLFQQLKTKAGSLHGLCVLPAFQRVTGPLAREAPFLRNTTDSRECEMRCPVRRSISSDRRGKVQLIRF